MNLRVVATEQNARIESVTLGIEDHGILTCFLFLDYGGGGQGFGGYALDQMAGKGEQSGYCAKFIRRVLETVGVSNWEDLPGKTIKVRASAIKVEAIAHILKDNWFNPATLLDDEE